MIYHYTIPQIPPSLNRFAGRKNEWEYRELKQEWKDMVYLLCRPLPQSPIPRATVTLTYYFGSRGRRDPDNYSGKMILDGLTAAGIIQDDSFQHIDLRVQGRYDKANPRTEITVEEEPEGEREQVC
jgi:Holliday junction resolvase RusA-like endonuclease